MVLAVVFKFKTNTKLNKNSLKLILKIKKFTYEIWLCNMGEWMNLLFTLGLLCCRMLMKLSVIF